MIQCFKIVFAMPRTIRLSLLCDSTEFNLKSLTNNQFVLTILWMFFSHATNININVNTAG